MACCYVLSIIPICDALLVPDFADYLFPIVCQLIFGLVCPWGLCGSFIGADRPKWVQQLAQRCSAVQQEYFQHNSTNQF